MSRLILETTEDNKGIVDHVSYLYYFYMSEQDEATSKPSKRPPHLSVASLGTNASGIADSTISFAGSEFTVSNFPVPPSQLPTPTFSSYSSPTSPRFTAPSIPDYATPTRFHFGFSSTPHSPADSAFSSYSKPRSHKSSYTAKSTPAPGQSREQTPPVPPLEPRRPGPPPDHLFPQPSTSHNQEKRFQSSSYQLASSSNPYVTGHGLEKRPQSPESQVAASSLLDWNDGASGISVNPSEERLLTTSFITSLLSQSPEPFPDKKLSTTRSKVVQRLDRSHNDSASQRSKSGLSSIPSGSRNSYVPTVASNYTSDQLMTNNAIFSNTSGRSTFASDQQLMSRLGSSKDASKNDPESPRWDESQIQHVVRIPSLSVTRGRTNSHPVGVAPAVRVSLAGRGRALDDTNSSSTNSMITSSSIAARPPVHYADAPQNVSRGRLDSFDIAAPRESEEDYVKISEGGLYLDHPDFPLSPAMPSSRGSHHTGHGSSGKSRASTNPPVGYPLQRTQSKKSVVSSIVSRISNSSAAQRAKYIAYLKKRPLPPLPNPPPELPDRRYIQKSEDTIPLPSLAKRAENLQEILSSGRYPSSGYGRNEFMYRESSGQNLAVTSDGYEVYVRINNNRRDHPNGEQGRIQYARSKEESGWNGGVDSPSGLRTMDPEQRKRKRRLWIVGICIVISIILAIAIPVGLTASRKAAHSCPTNMTGAACTLDATFTPEQISDAVVDVVGESDGTDCSKQVLLIDVEPGLDSASASNRTKFAQEAIFWNLILSEDVNATSHLRGFVANTAPWGSLSTSDGPVTGAPSGFVFNASGFSFDFAAQTVSPYNASFTDSSPSQQQLSELSQTAEAALDRMFSFAIASSTQRQRTLNNYWTSVLQQQESDLSSFISKVQNSPFLLTYDATSSPGGQKMTNIMANSTSTQFPPPISCYPGLNSTQIDRINALETTVFGLAPASSTSSFSASCFPDRPKYGVVDLLQARLPFPDGRKGVGLQGSALTNDAKIRTIIYSGEILSAFPGASTLPPILSNSTDPREFGNFQFLNHVLFNYLSTISNSNLTLAMDLVNFVLSSNSTTSIASDPSLVNLFSSLPVLEFAVFGEITPQDIDFSVSSFSTSDGSLFFGSSAAETFREWALVDSDELIEWTESAVSPQVVREGATVNANFEAVWKPASELANGGSTDANDVNQVTNSLTKLGLFSS
ncbi:hypothetical protein PNOK_0240100 [Pyrrhoderma noxium]|uniref:Uncharacterized protein n=1 Tax=Pyrrhoderma noxium TaxID=2282107 RepID=A0A286USC0_9AGAM|nr:hypothetical protein PNOK_0240100 [Pyrrhoderma noxium]